MLQSSTADASTSQVSGEFGGGGLRGNPCECSTCALQFDIIQIIIFILGSFVDPQTTLDPQGYQTERVQWVGLRSGGDTMAGRQQHSFTCNNATLWHLHNKDDRHYDDLFSLCAQCSISTQHLVAGVFTCNVIFRSGFLDSWW